MSPDSPNSPITPEQQALIDNLGAIFTPHAAERRKIVSRGPATVPYARLVHYTSAESALSIIRSKRFRLRNTNCMTDYREVQHGYDILYRYFANKEKSAAFIHALDDCAEGIAREAIDTFDTWSPDTRVNTYIASLSEHDDGEDNHGRLSMWRAFGGNTARVAVVLKVPLRPKYPAALGAFISPVAYLDEQATHAYLDGIVQNIRSQRELP